MTDLEDRKQATVIRDLGVSERFLCLASKEQPLHFLAVAEFNVRLEVEPVESALAALVDRHPLLTVNVTIQPDDRWMFTRSDGAGRPVLHVVDDNDATWQGVADNELHHPFDSHVDPLARLTLLRGDSYSALLLCFDHTISDGISSVCLLNDLVSALNGGVLTPLALQPSADSLINEALCDVEPLDMTQLDVDPRMAAPVVSARTDTATETLTTAVVSAADTSALAQRCRAERTTVHAALLVAASRVRATDLGAGFIRTMSPINIRSLLDVGQDCGLFVSTAITGLATDDRTPFWEQARGLTEQLNVARSPSGVRGMAQTMTETLPLDKGAAEVVDSVSQDFPCEMTVTNLGVKDIDDTGPIRPVAVWGPVVRNFGGDCIIGVVTYGGQLRMTAYGVNIAPAFLERITAELSAAATS